MSRSLLALVLLAACSPTISDLDSQIADASVEVEIADAAPTENSDAAVPRPEGELFVYTSNIENLETPNDQCKGDWRDLFFYMEQEGHEPDVVLFQQITNRAQLNDLAAHMTSKLGVTYAGIIAEADPAPFNSPCGQKKAKQTNAIIYRTDRLEPKGEKHIWKTFKGRDGSCVRDNLARTRSVMHAFTDVKTGAEVAIASIHWSTNQEGPDGDTACARLNVDEVDEKLRTTFPSAQLYVWGGDTNEPTLRNAASETSGYRPWYARANGDLDGALAYRDPVHRMCQERKSLIACLMNNWTIGQERRIDSMYFALPDGAMPETSAAHTVSFDEADAAAKAISGTDNNANYSDHRAVHARVHY